MTTLRFIKIVDGEVFYAYRAISNNQDKVIKDMYTRGYELYTPQSVQAKLLATVEV